MWEFTFLLPAFRIHPILVIETMDLDFSTLASLWGFLGGWADFTISLQWIFHIYDPLQSEVFEMMSFAVASLIVESLPHPFCEWPHRQCRFWTFLYLLSSLATFIWMAMWPLVLMIQLLAECFCSRYRSANSPVLFCISRVHLIPPPGMQTGRKRYVDISE